MDNALFETAADCAAVLKKIDELMSAELGTPAGDRLNEFSHHAGHSFSSQSGQSMTLEVGQL